MTRDQLREAVRALDPAAAKEILEEIVVDCIYMGRPMMTDTEILGAVCDTLKERGLDDGSEASEQELFGNE